jgi:hypothetical protein
MTRLFEDEMEAPLPEEEDDDFWAILEKTEE